MPNTEEVVNEVVNAEEQNANDAAQMKSSFNAEIGTVGGNAKQPSNSKIDELYELEKENNAMLKSIQEQLNVANVKEAPVIEEPVKELDQTEVFSEEPEAIAVPGVEPTPEKIDVDTTIPDKDEILEAVNSNTNTFSPVSVDSISLEEPEKIDSIEPVLTEVPENEYTQPIEPIKMPEEPKVEAAPVAPEAKETQPILSIDDLLASENKVEEVSNVEETVTPIPLEDPIIPITPAEQPVVNEPTVNDMPTVLPVENQMPQVETPAVNNVVPTVPAEPVIQPVVDTPVMPEAPVAPVANTSVPAEPVATNTESKSFKDITPLYAAGMASSNTEVHTGDGSHRRISVVSNDVFKSVNKQEKTLIMNQ